MSNYISIGEKLDGTELVIDAEAFTPITFRQYLKTVLEREKLQPESRAHIEFILINIPDKQGKNHE